MGSPDETLARHELRAAGIRAGFNLGPYIKTVSFTKTEPATVELAQGQYAVAELRMIADWLEKRDGEPMLSREQTEE